MSYDDAFRQEIVALKDEVIADLQADGIIFAEAAVSLVSIYWAGADPAAGIPGNKVETMTPISPRPRVDLREQWRQREGVAVRVGDALLRLTRAVDEATLTGATEVDIDGIRYTLVEGGLNRKALMWEAILKRIRA